MKQHVRNIEHFKRPKVRYLIWVFIVIIGIALTGFSLLNIVWLDSLK